MKDCIFCKIIKGEIPSKIIYQDDDFVIFADINPIAKLHYLAVPKEHYAHIVDTNTKQSETLGKILRKIPELTTLLHLEDGFRLIINQGENAGQEVQHLHIHILGGERLRWGK